MGALVFFESASELATLTNTFKVAGTPTDPTTISLTVTTPAQVSTTYTYAAAQITRSSAGVYTKDITCNEHGEWTYLWEGTGTASDAEPGTWPVFQTSLGRLYAPIATLKSRLGMAATDVLDDLELAAVVFAASRSVEQYCERLFYRSAAGTVATFEPTDRYCLKLPEFADLVSVATLKTDTAGDGTFATTWAAADYRLWPYNPSLAPEVKPYTKVKAIGGKTFPLNYGYGNRADMIQITGVFGWPSVPVAVKLSTAMLAQELFKSKDTFGGVAGFGEYGVVRIRENPVMTGMLKPYQRNAVLVR